MSECARLFEAERKKQREETEGDRRRQEETEISCRDRTYTATAERAKDVPEGDRGEKRVREGKKKRKTEEIEGCR